MGTAILAGIRRKFSVKVCEADLERSAFLKSTFKITTQNLETAVKAADVVLLAVKPQDFVKVLNDLRPLVNSKKFIISIAAGISTNYIEKQLGGNIRVIRAMPNMPAQIGEGITAACAGRFAKEVDIRLAVEIFNHIGKTIVVEEYLMDAITAVSGSGPAYVFLFVECLVKAAQTLGLNENQSKELVLKTLTGSVHLLEKSKDDAATLRSKVTSKGGTTQAAMDVFLNQNIEKMFEEALSAAKRRAEELMK